MKLAQLFSLYKLIGRERRTMRKTEAKRPRQRASAFVLESLENRVLLSATPVDVTTTEPVVTAAVVTTDKADWIRPDNDGTVNGSISTDWFVEDQYLGASLLLTATGQASGAVATTAFTDSAAFTSSISPTSVTYGSSGSITLIVTNANTNN